MTTTLSAPTADTTSAEGVATPVHTLFEARTAPRLTYRDLVDLASGTTAVLRVRDFFPADYCSSLLDRLATCDMGSYDETVVRPRIAKLGPAAYDYYFDDGLSDDYWEHAAESHRTRRSLSDDDPLDRATRSIRAAWPGGVTAATVDGRQLFAGMLREINQGARIHFDEVVREFPGVLDETPIIQLAFNCHLSMPETGGEATVYRRRWRPEDEGSREGYGYSSSVVDGEPTVSVLPAPGDAVLFDPRNYHRVESSTGGRRVTLSFFLGITAVGRMIMWS
ncbi:2OG-Fe(II) oxygenase [Williamsia sp. MIQD14]|uniref:2OG-Fe(II) oxygenase n=1 Tax=Williamsia sp. MIQD14 TaxID=3425703 RepID=UPI003DA1945C